MLLVIHELRTAYQNTIKSRHYKKIYRSRDMTLTIAHMNNRNKRSENKIGKGMFLQRKKLCNTFGVVHNIGVQVRMYILLVGKLVIAFY